MNHHRLLAITPSLRLNFVLLSVAVIAMTVAWGVWIQGSVDWLMAFQVLWVAVLAHVLVNLKNEIEDTQSGLDAQTIKTPFSGGTGALVTNVSNLLDAKSLNRFLWMIFVASGVGILVQIDTSKTPLIPLILLVSVGVWLIYFYTSICTKYPLLAWMSSGLAFGPVMMLCAAMVLVPEYWFELIVWTLIPFLWVNNLLLINQFPDQWLDKAHGRNNIVIQSGYGVAVRIYMLSALLSVVILTALLVVQELSIWLLLWWLPVGWVCFELWKLYQSELKDNPIDSLEKQTLLANTAILQKIQGLTVVINLLLPMSIAIVFLLS